MCFQNRTHLLNAVYVGDAVAKETKAVERHRHRSARQTHIHESQYPTPLPFPRLFRLFHTQAYTPSLPLL